MVHLRLWLDKVVRAAPSEGGATDPASDLAAIELASPPLPGDALPRDDWLASEGRDRSLCERRYALEGLSTANLAGSGG